MSLCCLKTWRNMKRFLREKNVWCLYEMLLILIHRYMQLLLLNYSESGREVMTKVSVLLCKPIKGNIIAGVCTNLYRWRREGAKWGKHASPPWVRRRQRRLEMLPQLKEQEFVSLRKLSCKPTTAACLAKTNCGETHAWNTHDALWWNCNVC